MVALKNNPLYSTIFICTANQCRSPIAEKLLSQYGQTQGYDQDMWTVGSAGCWAYPDQPATKMAIQAMEFLCCDLSLHSSQSVTEVLLQKYNLILCMEAAHKSFIKRHFPEMSEKVILLSKIIGEEFDIDDPIGGELENYIETAQKIKSIIISGFEKIFELSKK